MERVAKVQVSDMFPRCQHLCVSDLGLIKVWLQVC